MNNSVIHTIYCQRMGIYMSGEEDSEQRREIFKLRLDTLAEWYYICRNLIILHLSSKYILIKTILLYRYTMYSL